MRLARYECDGKVSLGVVEGSEIVDAAVGVADWSEWFELSDLARGRLSETLASARRVPLSGVRLLTPLARPGKIICLGLNYYDHAAEGGNAKPEYPAFFFRGATSLLAPDAPILRPRCSDKLDYEAELAVVIGKRVRHATRVDALSYVAGYACFNDATLRDYQRKTAQWTIGKNFDATGAFGPWIVTPDELPAGATGLRIQSRLNGQPMQDSNTDHMIWDVAETISLLTECLTLEPGDVIAMGTPAGVGYPRTPPVFMKPGDTIEIHIDGIGVLANSVEDEL